MKIGRKIKKTTNKLHNMLGLFCGNDDSFVSGQRNTLVDQTFHASLNLQNGSLGTLHTSFFFCLCECHPFTFRIFFCSTENVRRWNGVAQYIVYTASKMEVTLLLMPGNLIEMSLCVLVSFLAYHQFQSKMFHLLRSELYFARIKSKPSQPNQKMDKIQATLLYRCVFIPSSSFVVTWSVFIAVYRFQF